MQDFAIDFLKRKSNILLGKFYLLLDSKLPSLGTCAWSQKNVPLSIWNFDNPLLGGKKHSTDFCILNIDEVI